jgi:hypothetical protein
MTVKDIVRLLYEHFSPYGEIADIHMRTDANNLVTTASATHLPEQKETIHMIHMLRKEACSGSIHDLAHVRTAVCLSDCLTKHSAKPDALLNAVQTGVLPQVDCHPNFRDLLKHKAYLIQWLNDVFDRNEATTKYDMFLDVQLYRGEHGFLNYF